LILILRDVGPDVVSPAELRRILRDVAKLPLDDDDKAKSLMEEKVLAAR